MFYVSDYTLFTANSTLALNAQLIQNELGSGVDSEESALASERACFANAASTKATNKAKRGFYLRSMAMSSPATQVEKAAKIRFDPFVKDEDYVECAAGKFGGGYLASRPRAISARFEMESTKSK